MRFWERFWQFELWQALLLTTLVAILLNVWVLPFTRQLDVWDSNSVQSQRVNEEIGLISAAASGKMDWVATYLEEGVNPHAIHAGRSALDAAVGGGHLGCAKLLLDAGARVSERGAQAVHQLVESESTSGNKLAVLNLLMTHGLQLRKRVGGYSLMDTAVRQAAGDVIDLLRDLGEDFGPREMAAAGRLQDLQNWLKRERGAINAHVSAFGERPLPQEPTLLAVALHCGRDEIAHWLLENGATIPVTQANELSVVHLAVQGQCTEATFQRLAGLGCDFNLVNSDGHTPLSLLVWTRGQDTPPDLLKALIRSGANVNFRHEELGATVSRMVLTSRDYRRRRSNLPAQSALLKILAEAGADQSDLAPLWFGFDPAAKILDQTAVFPLSPSQR